MVNAGDQFREVITAAVLLVMAFVVLGYFVATVPADTSAVTNETWTPDTGNWTSLNNDNFVSGSETVYNATGVEMGSSHYSLDREKGRIKALDPDGVNTTGLQDGSTANISYSHEHTPEEVSEVSTSLQDVLRMGVLVILVMMLGLVFAGLYFFNGSGRKRGGRRR